MDGCLQPQGTKKYLIHTYLAELDLTSENNELMYLRLLCHRVVFAETMVAVAVCESPNSILSQSIPPLP